MTKRRRYLWQHMLAWAALYFFWILVFQKRAFAFTQTLTVQFCYLIFIAANFYFNRNFTIPRWLYRKKYFLFALGLTAGILVTAALRVPAAMYLNKHYFLPGRAQPGPAVIFYSSLLNIFIWVIFIVAGMLISDRYRLQQYLTKIEKEKDRAELDFLNAQFNPHFLFNSINSIYGHIDKQNAAARNMLLTFSEMLRYQLYECNTPAITIDKEIAYLRNYILMQKSRKEDGLLVELQVDSRVTGFSIAPLLFIAFIENAFKYVGSSGDCPQKVIITFLRTADGLRFKCRNTRENLRDNGITDKGIGISNARRRMALLYPDKHELHISDKENHYEVTVNLDLS